MAGKIINQISNKDKLDLVGFDLDEEHLKMVHVHLSKLKREVVGIAYKEIRGLADEEVGAFIQSSLKDWGLKSPRAFITIPLYPVITRSIEIPSRDPVEIREIVNLQASRHTPYSRAEIIIDTLPLGVVRENYTKVLLVIAPREIVTKQVRLVEKVGLKVEKILFSPEGICQACTKILGNETTDAVTAVVHMDAWFTSFTVIQKGKIVFTRCIAIGASNLMEAKDVFHDRFIEELRKSLEAYTHDEAGPMPSLLLLTGVVAEITDLDTLFDETLHMPIRHQTYFNYFPISQPAKAVASASKMLSYFNLIAPLLLFDKMAVDLIPDEYRLKRELEKRGREIMKTAMLVMLLLGLLFSVFLSKLYFKKAYLQHLVHRYAHVREAARELQKDFDRNRLIKNYLLNRGNSLSALTELYNTLPTDVKLTNVRYEEGERFTLKGTSWSMGSVFSFVTNLEKSGRFSNVKTKYVNTRAENGEDVADFEILATLGKKGAE